MPYRADGVGYQRTDTSAAAMPSKPETIRAMVFDCVVRAPATCDEVAHKLKISPFTVRPRLTELRNASKIVDSGTRRVLDSGKTGIVWKEASRQLAFL